MNTQRRTGILVLSEDKDTLLVSLTLSHLSVPPTTSIARRGSPHTPSHSIDLDLSAVFQDNSRRDTRDREVLESLGGRVVCIPMNDTEERVEQEPLRGLHEDKTYGLIAETKWAKSRKAVRDKYCNRKDNETVHDRKDGRRKDNEETSVQGRSAHVAEPLGDAADSTDTHADTTIDPHLFAVLGSIPQPPGPLYLALDVSHYGWEKETYEAIYIEWKRLRRIVDARAYLAPYPQPSTQALYHRHQSPARPSPLGMEVINAEQ